MNEAPATHEATETRTTRDAVERLLASLAAGDLEGLAALFAPELDWRLGWPASELGGDIPWIRPRRTPADVKEHFRTLAEHNEPYAGGTSIDHVLVDGNHAVITGTIRNVLRRNGVSYEADFALHLTIEAGLIRRYHIYEDTLAVARAWNAGTAQPSSR